MGEVGRLVQFVHTQTFQPVQPPATDNEWTKRAGLVVTDNNQMKFARKCIATSLYPGILVHRAVGVLRKQPPALRLIVDGAKFLEDPY